MMQVIGLTGGIASGKSTVQAMLIELGASVLDADRIYHELVAPLDGPSPLARQIEGRFPGTLLPDGRLDRVRLGARVFADTAERRALEAIAHPAVAAAFSQRAASLAATGCPLVVYDVPLLFERGLESNMAGVIVVWVARDIQLQRLAARDRLSQTEADQRLTAQLALDEKRRRATWVVDNSGPLSETRKQTRELWPVIAARFGRPPA